MYLVARQKTGVPGLGRRAASARPVTTSSRLYREIQFRGFVIALTGNSLDYFLLMKFKFSFNVLKLKFDVRHDVALFTFGSY